MRNKRSIVPCTKTSKETPSKENALDLHLESHGACGCPSFSCMCVSRKTGKGPITAEQFLHFHCPPGYLLSPGFCMFTMRLPSIPHPRILITLWWALLPYSPLQNKDASRKIGKGWLKGWSHRLQLRGGGDSSKHMGGDRAMWL